MNPPNIMGHEFAEEVMEVGSKVTKVNKGDMDDLKRVSEDSNGKFEQTLIITDGVFSMDGDLAKSPEIVALAKTYGALTYVDDAHGSGVLGENGRGTVDHFHLHGQVDFIVGTLSKAIGVVSGYVAGSKEMRTWVLHRGRPLLLSTAMMLSTVAAIIEAIHMLEESSEYTDTFWDNGNYFKGKLSTLGFNIGHNATSITPVIIGDEALTMKFSKTLLERGVYVSGIIFPTVPKGTGRIRCMVSALHTKDQLDQAVEIIKTVGLELGIIQ